MKDSSAGAPAGNGLWPAAVFTAIIAGLVTAQVPESAFDRDPWAMARQGPLKVFILAGQSNMQGHAALRTLEYLIHKPGISLPGQWPHLYADGQGLRRSDAEVARGSRLRDRRSIKGDRACAIPPGNATRLHVSTRPGL